MGSSAHQCPPPCPFCAADAYNSNIALYYSDWWAVFKQWYDAEAPLYDYNNPGFQ